MSKKNVAVSRNCRDAVNRLHEAMKVLDLAKMNLAYKEKSYTIAIAFLSLWIGFAVADFVAAATVVYSIGPVVGMKPEHVFWSPEAGVFINFTWFGVGLFVSIASTLLALPYAVFCSLSRRVAREKMREMNEKLKDAKSAILEVCPMELWYSGEA